MLDGLDLPVAHGERVAVLGPNGAGKTTLMLHLNGLLRGAGELEVAGLRVGPDDAAARCAPASGSSSRTPTTSCSCRPCARTSRFGPRNLGLDQARGRRRGSPRRSPRCGWSTPPTRAPHQLSLGERRRVAIATVLAMDPRLLVLDEPSANLDPRARRELLEPARRRSSRTLLVVTHDLPFAAELCERAVILVRRPDRRRRPDARRSSPTPRCSPAHDLELPAGFDPALVRPR